MDVPQGLLVVTSLIKYDIPLTCWVTSFVWKEREIENRSVKKQRSRAPPVPDWDCVEKRSCGRHRERLLAYFLRVCSSRSVTITVVQFAFIFV